MRAKEKRTIVLAIMLCVSMLWTGGLEEAHA